jgi:hypothetical protein
MSTSDTRFDQLETQLGDAVLLAEAGQLEQALVLLEVHDAAVRRYARAASGDMAGPLRELLEAQRRVFDRLLALRDEAGRAVSAICRQRRGVAAYARVG